MYVLASDLYLYNLYYTRMLLPDDCDQPAEGMHCTRVFDVDPPDIACIAATAMLMASRSPALFLRLQLRCCKCHQMSRCMLVKAAKQATL